MNAEDRFTWPRANGILSEVTELRVLRRSFGLSQKQFAQRLGVPPETLRTWDSGRRRTPASVVERARDAVSSNLRDTQLLRLYLLAAEFSVHVRTLRAAAKTGKLVVHFSERSAFGRPMLFTTPEDVRRFKAAHYRRSRGQSICPEKLPCVPSDYDEQLKCLRRRLRLNSTAHRPPSRLGGDASLIDRRVLMNRHDDEGEFNRTRLIALEHHRRWFQRTLMQNATENS